MSEQDNRRIAEEMIAALNAHDLDRYVRSLDDTYVWESETLPTPVRGREGARQALEMYLGAFPDLRFETEEIITTGDRIISRWRVTATHKGEFLGIAPTNRPVSTRGCTVIEVRNGKLVRNITYTDNATLFQQLGVLGTGKTSRAGR